MYATRVTRVFIADVSGILRSSLTAPRYCEKKKQQNTKFRRAYAAKCFSVNHLCRSVESVHGCMVCAPAEVLYSYAPSENDATRAESGSSAVIVKRNTENLLEST